MSKRKPAAAPKHVRRPKAAAKAQRAKQAIVRSPKSSSLRSISEGATETLAEGQNNSSQEASRVAKPVSAVQDDFKQTVRDNNPKSAFDLSSATASVRAYQEKLLEISQANMKFSFEFAQRFATIKSPVEFLKVIKETYKQASGHVPEAFKRDG